MVRIIAPITAIETIAKGPSIRDLYLLRQHDGSGRWRKKDPLVRGSRHRQGENEGETMAPEFVVCLRKEETGDLSGDDLQLGRHYELVEKDTGQALGERLRELWLYRRQLLISVAPDGYLRRIR